MVGGGGTIVSRPAQLETSVEDGGGGRKGLRASLGRVQPPPDSGAGSRPECRRPGHEVSIPCLVVPGMCTQQESFGVGDPGPQQT